VWRRPVAIATTAEGRTVLMRYDGKDHVTRPIR
jgi:hypothetical protein